MIYENERGEARVSSLVADRTVFVERGQARPVLIVGKQNRLGEDFFNEIINHPVPLNLNTLNALKRSPWASISTCGWSTAPSPFALRYGSLGGSCTASSERTRTKPATSSSSATSVQSASAS